MIDENEIIAEYVKLKFPQILSTLDYSSFKVGYEIGKELFEHLKREREEEDD